MSKTLGGGTGRILSLYTPSAMVGDLHPVETSTCPGSLFPPTIATPAEPWEAFWMDRAAAYDDTPVTDEERRQSDEIDADAESEARYGENP